MNRPLVSVVVPVYNAAATLDETLTSIRAQTYIKLEIIVVDDGSCDATAAIAEDHARADSRIGVVRQENAGVAAARNRGIAEAAGDFIAPIDADDLWKPTKIEKQMDLLLSNGPDVGLVYTWQARVDKNGCVTSTVQRPTAEGWVLPDMLKRNIVGSGSAALMRREAILEAGGYDSSLRANDAEGCEDLKLYRLIAERYRFARVPEFLTGYRKIDGTMSTKLFQMLRSHDLVSATFRERHPELVEAIDEGCAFFRQGLISKAVRARDWNSAAILMLNLVSSYPAHALRLPLRTAFVFTRWASGRFRHRRLTTEIAPPFLSPVGASESHQRA